MSLGVGLGIGLGGGGSTGPAFADRTLAQSFAFIASPSPIASTWNNAGNPTVRVEKDWGTGVYQDLYAGADGSPRTAPNGGGQKASDWAGSSKLFVERIYNQAGSDPSTDYISPISPDLRVLLNVATDGAPFFAGYSTGTQDANQHATQRGYALPTSLKIKTNDHPLSMIAAHQHSNGTETVNLVQDTTNGSTAYWNLDAGNKRHYVQWAIATGTYDQVSTAPHVLCQWALDDCRGIATEYSQRTGVGGIYTGNNTFTSSASSYGLNLFGPVNSLRGKCFAVMIATGALDYSAMLNGGIPAQLGGTFAKAIANDLPAINFPYSNAVIPMNLATQTADIPVRLIGKPLTAYQASWQGGSYATIGTTDANGYLAGAMTGQAKGNGTLNIREVGGSTPIAVTNVAVGFVLAVSGESEPDGRGSNVAVSIPTGSLRKDRANWTTLQAYGSQGFPTPAVIPITNPGSGYTVNDEVTLVGGTGTAAKVKVTSVDGLGAVTGLTASAGGVIGAYSVAPSTPTSVTGGTGTGLTVSPVYSQGNQYWLRFLQYIYDTFSCVIGVTYTTTGGTYFHDYSHAASSANGQWWLTPSSAVSPPLSAQARNKALAMQFDFMLPNVWHWDLGKNDAGLLASTSNTPQLQTGFAALLADYQSKVNSSIAFSIIASGENGVVTAAYTDAVRAQELTLVNTVAGFNFSGSFAHIHGDLDNTHMSSQTQKDKARDVMVRYTRHLWLGGSQARAPQYSSASKSGSQIIVTLTGGTSPMTHSGVDVNGWKVSDGNGARTVSSVSASGMDVTLTCDQALSGTVSLQWASDNTSIGTTLLDSDATTPLPPEPFGPVSL